MGDNEKKVIKNSQTDIIIAGDNNTLSNIDKSITNIKKYIYNYNVVYNVVSNIPDKNDGFRGVLSSIENATHKPQQIFSGFINYADTRYNKVVLCNIFWNNNVYVCDHINIKQGKDMLSGIDIDDTKNIRQRDILIHLGGVSNLRVGDFIVFKGFIYSYPYNNEPGRFNKGIRLEKIIDVVHRTDDLHSYVLESYEKDSFNSNIISSMSQELLKRYYDIQLNRIRILLEPTKYYTIEMYEAILQTVVYEGTRELVMIKNQMQINIDQMDDKIFIGVSLLRYLVTVLDEKRSPYVIYTYMNKILKPKKGESISPTYNKFNRKFSEYGVFIDDNDFVSYLKKQFYIEMNNYIDEFINIVFK